MEEHFSLLKWSNMYSSSYAMVNGVLCLGVFGISFVTHCIYHKVLQFLE